MLRFRNNHRKHLFQADCLSNKLNNSFIRNLRLPFFNPTTSHSPLAPRIRKKAAVPLQSVHPSGFPSALDHGLFMHQFSCNRMHISHPLLFDMNKDPLSTTKPKTLDAAYHQIIFFLYSTTFFRLPPPYPESDLHGLQPQCPCTFSDREFYPFS